MNLFSGRFCIIYRMRKPSNFWLAILLVGVVCFTVGWIANNISRPGTAPSKSLRLNGYQFIDPLLVCNVNNTTNASQEDTSLSTSIASIINRQEQADNLSK